MMPDYKFSKELYSKIALLKAAYNFTDIAYIHLDSDPQYYYVHIEPKEDMAINEADFENELLTQSVRHEVYLQTHNIRELLLARALATSVVADEEASEVQNAENEQFSEDGILRDWFEVNEQ